MKKIWSTHPYDLTIITTFFNRPTAHMVPLVNVEDKRYQLRLSIPLLIAVMFDIGPYACRHNLHGCTFGVPSVAKLLFDICNKIIRNET